MTDEPLNPIERLRVHLTLEHHEEDADAFALVDSLIQSYALEYPDDLTADAQELQTLLLDVIESWTPARVCAGCGKKTPSTMGSAKPVLITNTPAVTPSVPVSRNWRQRSMTRAVNWKSPVRS